MRAAMSLIGLILMVGTGVGVYLGVNLRRDKKKAQLTSKTIRTELDYKRQRDEAVLNWLNEHEVLSDNAFGGFKHLSENIGGVIVTCPKCKEL